MATSTRTGVNEKLYRNTGSHASPVWSEITIASDVDLNMDKSTSEVKSRASKQVKHLAAMQQSPLDFEIVADKTNAAFNVLRNAYIADTIMEFAVCDQAIASSGAAYWKQEYLLKGFKVSQKLESHETVKVEAVPSYLGLDGAAAADGAWVDVS